MSTSSTKAGTGAGSYLVISSVPATLAAPAQYPAQPPVPMVVAAPAWSTLTTYTAGQIVSSAGNNWTAVTPITGTAPATAAWTEGPAVTGIAILQLKEFSIPEQTWKYDSVTNTGSPTIGVGVMEESLATTVDPGTFTATGVFLPSDLGTQALQTAFATGIANSFQVSLKPIAGQSVTGNTYAFTGFVSKNPVPTNIDASKAATIKVEIKLDSLMTVATGN